jgi:hypothetical protein
VSSVLLLDRLRESDLALVARAAREPGSTREVVDRLRADPRRIEALLDRPEVFEALFGRTQRDPLLVAAPFLAFSVLLARARRLLREVSFVHEWVGPERRIPVFDVSALREFLDDPARRAFLADVLTSYTHVASGTVWTRTSRGWRRRRFSELDPVHLAELIGASPEHERPLLWRRLGDLSLFLTGVFPDHTNGRLFGPRAIGRLRRAVGGGLESGLARESHGGVPLMELVGRRSYLRAWEATEPRDAGMAMTMREVGERFRHARRVLNLLTERYLFPFRGHWFPPTNG